MLNKLKTFGLISLFWINSSHGYEHFYYQDEGQLLFKMKALYYDTGSNKATFTNDGTSVSSNRSIFSQGYGAEGSVTYFYNSSFAAELSAGIAQMKMRSSELTSVINGLGASGEPLDNREALAIPLSAIIQYHVAPYGGIRPYIGAGYSATFLTTKSKNISLETAHGAVIQAGLDFVSKSDSYISLEVKQYLLKPKVTIEESLLASGKKSVSKVKLNPLTISIGFGFRM